MKQNIQRIALSLFAAVLLMSVVTGCKSTASGAGKDIEKMGEKIQDKTE